jgi:hypothetical protein
MIATLKDYLKCIQTSVQKSKRFDAPWALISPIYCRIFYGIGARDFSLFSLHNKPKHTWSDYISNEPFKSIIATVASLAHRKIADDKLEFQHFCRAKNINTPKILDTFDFNISNGSNAFLQHLSYYENGEYFAKSRFGSHGANAFHFKVTNGTATAMADNENSHAFQSIVNQLAATKSEIIIQHKVLNHPSIIAITASKSLSTIRVVTVRNGLEIVIVAACARLIVGQNETDSFFHGQRGNIVAEINLSQGLIVRCKHSCDRSFPNIVDLNRHPISGAELIGFRIPYWDDLIQKVTKAHLAFDGLKSVGWDVAITRDEALIIEANWRYDVDLIQVSHDRGFMPLVQEYFFNQGADNEKFNHRHS